MRLRVGYFGVYFPSCEHKYILALLKAGMQDSWVILLVCTKYICRGSYLRWIDIQRPSGAYMIQ